MKKIYEGVTHTVKISTNVNRTCQYCDQSLGGPAFFTKPVNHYIDVHDYKLLHVGTETSHAEEGLWYSTVAVLGI